ncbi:MAG: hypothetical protein QOH73_180, partial [Gaiellaceae bacterium]|nr:hypothetical protein [Gaiellaceae bacterium]
VQVPTEQAAEWDDLAAGDEAERRLDGLAVVAVVDGVAPMQAGALDVRVERRSVATLPPGLGWRVSAEGAAQLLVAEVAQR